MDNEKKYKFLSQDPNVKTKPIMISLIIGAFFAILNETLLNIALITLMDEFNITLPTVQWMATGFMLVMGIVIPVSALFLQWFTTRQLFLGTMIIFTIGTIIAASAPTFSILLAGRLVQAVGTGMLMPILFNVFLLIYPPEVRGKIMGTLGLVIMFAPAIGPTLSGVIVEYLGWRYLFIVVIPFAVFSILFAYRYLVNVSEVTKPKIDWLSVILSTVGFGATIYGFSSVGKSDAGFTNIDVLVPMLLGITSIVLFVLRQLQLESPVMDVRVFKYPMFTHAVVMFIIIVMTMFASELVLPLFMQGALLLSAATAGLVLLPGSILNGLMSPFMGALFDKVGPRVMMIPATIVLSGTMFIFSRMDLDTPPWVIVAGFMLIMLSVSATMMPAETNGLNQLPKHFYPHGTAVISSLQPLAGAIGVSVFISILNTRQASYLSGVSNPEAEQAVRESFVAGVELVYFIIFLFTLVAVLLSFIVYRAKPVDESEFLESVNNSKDG